MEIFQVLKINTLHLNDPFSSGLQTLWVLPDLEKTEMGC